MVYDVNSDKRQVLGMLKEIKLAFDDLRAEYVAKGASDVDEVCLIWSMYTVRGNMV